MMGQGLEVRGASGRVVHGTGDRLARVLGVVSGSTGGSLVDSKLNEGIGYAVQTNDTVYSVFIQISGSTVTWQWPWGSAASFTFVYGVR